jgi:ketosteroid isomerase-like protein
MAGYESARAAEQAFYDAFGQGSLSAMTEVWADDPDIVCVHPGGERLQGREAVLESWGEILGAMRDVVVRITDVVVLSQGRVAVHHAREQLFVDGQRRGVILATNVYRQTTQGWQMVLHHGAPDPSPPPALESGALH